MECPCHGGAVIGVGCLDACPHGLEKALHEAMRREEAVLGLERRIGIGVRVVVMAS